MSVIPNGVIRIEEGIDSNKFVIATYLMQGEPQEDALARAVSMAVEQTVGRGIFDMPEMLSLLEARGAKVLSYFAVPDHESRVTERGTDWTRYIVRIAYPVENTAFQIPMVLNNVMSDICLGGMLKLVDLVLPACFVDAFKGPKFGAEGIRRITGTLENRRPLTCTILKPCVGMQAKSAAEIFYQHALGGADFIKDDENMSYWGDMTIEDRVKAVMEAERKAFEKTGEHVTYLCNVSDKPDRMIENALRAVEAGASGLMLTPLTTGIGALQMLAEHPDLNVPVFAHPGGLGATSWSPDFGISEHIYISKLFRLAGADMVAIPVPYGKFTHRRDKFIKMFKLNGSPMRQIKTIFTQTGGGVNPINAYTAIQDIGNDVMMVAGGAIQEHPMGMVAGIRALRQSIEAYAAGVPLEEAAKQHEELRSAYQKWCSTK
ncbi:MAG: RuBisCO large subunit C-terminal-like domain-containing protein [Anaerolineaceae bacterium]|nr:RuBisCO large subunit C-terminal-like domain-containing protein [Anaerolineaceae bacterium]